MEWLKNKDFKMTELMETAIEEVTTEFACSFDRFPTSKELEACFNYSLTKVLERWKREHGYEEQILVEDSADEQPMSEDDILKLQLLKYC